jgi:hypothetical protein
MSPVEFYILEKDQHLKSILQKLHNIIISSAPSIEAKLTYNIPFYYYLGRVCYLNPKAGSVDLGFCRGALLGENHLLGRTELKEVRIINFKSLPEIQEETVVPLIFEALLLNEMIKKKK